MARLTQTIQLPSNGKIYPMKELTIQSLTVNEIKSLYSTQGETGLYKCMQGCITEDIDIKDLVLGDLAYVLLKIRALTFGNTYTVDLRCQNIIMKNGVKDICNYTFPHTIELSKLEVGFLPDNFTTTIKLPESGDMVEIRLLTANQIKQFQSDRDQALATLKVDKDEFEFVCNIAQHLKKIPNQQTQVEFPDLPLMMAYDYVNRLSAKDAFFLQDYVNSIECGPDLNFEVECPSCHNKIRLSMPMGLEFFRPQTRQ